LEQYRTDLQALQQNHRYRRVYFERRKAIGGRYRRAIIVVIDSAGDAIKE
jgi:hypothetical protein